MDKVIKDGSLRLLITESSCDVILSCSDHRLMAHKLILSIASPVLKDLLDKDSSDSTLVLILPDVSSATMSAILEYIYTGTVLLYAPALPEFLSATQSLQIAVDTQDFEDILNIKKWDNKEFYVGENKEKTLPDNLISDSRSSRTDSSDSISYAEELSYKSQQHHLDHSNWNQNLVEEKKTDKKLPALLPIDSGISRSTSSKVSKVVVPSPWRQREKSFLGDPRIVPPGPDLQITKLCIEDNNNNFQQTYNRQASTTRGSAIMHNLNLSNPITKKQNLLICGNMSESKSGTFKQDSTVLVCDRNIHKLELPRQEIAFSTKYLTDVIPLNKKSLKIHQHKLQSEDLSGSLQVKNTKKDMFSSTITTPSAKMSKKPCDIRDVSVYETSTTKPSLTSTNLNVNELRASRSKQVVVDSTSDSSNDLIEETHNRNERTEKEDDCGIESIVSEVSENDNDNDEKERTKCEKKKVFKCNDCGKCFKQLRNYKYHRSIHEGTKEFSAKCPECDKTFNDRGYLSSHMKIHRDRKEYACTHCPKRFNQRVAYNMHLRIHTGVKPHVCPTCGKSFSRKMLLKQHQRVHTGERPYSCPECGKSFADRSNMSLHARLHTGVKPYTCTVCPKSFTKKHHLKTHMNFHTGLKPYSCENCGLAFSQSSNMRTHYKKCILKEQSGNKKDS